MQIESFLDLAQNYAMQNYQREETPVFKAFGDINPLMSFEDYKVWVKEYFQDYFMVVCLMSRGDDDQIEFQLKDDYFCLVNHHNKVNKDAGDIVVDKNKQVFREILAHAIYFCDYRMYQITLDEIKYDLSKEVTDIKYNHFKDCRLKWSKMLTDVIEDFHKNVKENSN
jgi:hypothetical protein